jgi:hypothetical protein
LDQILRAIIRPQETGVQLMQFRLVRYFLAVAEEKHFARAASSCNVSQPKLSAELAALEDPFLLLPKACSEIEPAAEAGTVQPPMS